MTQDEVWLLQEKHGGVESEAFHADLKRLASGEPLAYIIGFIPFLDCQIHLDSHPLIPRSETEYWVEKAILKIKKQGRGLTAESLGRQRENRAPVSVHKILDLCAGSGAIGVAVAKAIPETHVTFGEIDRAHLSTISKNLNTNDIPCTSYQVFQSNLFENITGQFDYILTNPPYINPAIDRTEDSVKKFEPHLALYGGNNGMEIISKIITEARAHLNPNGQLWIEHEPEQMSAIFLLAHELGFSHTSCQDQYKKNRYSILVI